MHIPSMFLNFNLYLFPVVPAAVSLLTDDLLKYYQRVTRAVLGDDLHLMKVREQKNNSVQLTFAVYNLKMNNQIFFESPILLLSQ